MSNPPVTHAGITVNRYETGQECVESATQRASNTTIVIGVDRIGGTLAIDIDTQSDVHPQNADLAKDLRMIAEVIEMGENNE